MLQSMPMENAAMIRRFSCSVGCQRRMLCLGHLWLLLMPKLQDWMSLSGCSTTCRCLFRNTISWTALLTGFTRNRRCIKALDLFKQMLEESVNPSAQTFVSVLGACADEALIGRGKEVHGQIIRYSNSEKNLLNVYIYNALIVMYGKCGDMKSAEILFEMAPMRDLPSRSSPSRFEVAGFYGRAIRA
ncbi:hypothetical protein PIB30_037107 [Stylosanthes scabra]|uniref:Pentatricopeptide repeat-containing protein n=1 Tax=Stylosanthes scabra TaxID=79078 RepID=A0ABU6YAX4_9FABA|nr:hypothetical protein [Stylosanthes scabra]